MLQNIRIINSAKFSKTEVTKKQQTKIKLQNLCCLKNEGYEKKSLLKNVTLT